MARDVTINIRIGGGKRARREVKLTEEQFEALRKAGVFAGKDASRGLDKIGKSAGRLKRITDVALGTLAGNLVPSIVGGVKRGLRETVQLGATMDAQMADLSAITGIVGEDLRDLGETAKQESIRTGVAAKDQVEAYKLLASRIDGLSTEGLKEVGREVVTLAQASKEDLAVAAEVAAGAINQFDLEASDSARVVNVLAAASKEGAAEVGDLGAAMVNVGPSAKGAGVSIEETAAALEIMAENNLIGAQAGTQLKGVLTTLRAEGKKLAEAGIKDVNIETDGLNATLVKLKPLLSDAETLTRLFGRENINAAEALIGGAEAVEDMTARITDTNVAQEQAVKQMNTLEGATARLDAAVSALVLDAFEAYGDELIDLINLTGEAVQYAGEHSGEIVKLAKVLAALTVGLVTYKGTLKLASFQTGVWTAATRGASVAQAAFNLSLAAGRRGVHLLTAAIRANPLGLLATLATTAATAFLLFRDNADEATEAVQRQRDEVKGLTSDLKKLGGAQLFQRQMQIETNLDEVKRQAGAVYDQISAIYGDPRVRDFTVTLADGTEQVLSRTEALKVLRQDLNGLSEKRRGLEDALVAVQERGMSNLLFRRAALQREVDLLVEEGVESEELVQKRAALAEIEEEIQALRQGSTETLTTDTEQATERLTLAEKERRAVAEREFALREAEISAMRESREKTLREIDLEVDRRAERYRQQYAAQYPQMFDDLSRLLEEERQRLKTEALAEDIPLANFTPPTLEDIDLSLDGAFLELPTGEIEMVEESIRAVDEALADLQAQFDAATTEQGRAEIAALMEKLRSLRGEMAAGGADVLDLGATIEQGLGDAIAGAAQAIGEGQSVVDALVGTLGALAQRVGKMMIGFGVAGLKLQALVANPVGAIVAGAALIALGAAAKSAVAKEVGGKGGAGQKRRVDNDVPRFAQGVTGFEGGAAIVGEEGPELVTLGRGANVITNENTTKIIEGMRYLNAGAAQGAGGAAALDTRDLERRIQKGIAGGLREMSFKLDGLDLRASMERTDRFLSKAGLD